MELMLSTLEYDVALCDQMCGVGIGRDSITWEFVRNVNPQAPPQTY